MKFPIILSLAVITALVSCSGQTKKVLIMASSDIKVTDKNIQVTEGTTHHEQTETFTDSKLTLSLQLPSGNSTVDATEGGLYILNLKNDNLVGSFQRIGSTAGARISRDQLQGTIDSLKQISIGQNISVTNKNYFIPPGKMVKITSELNAKVFGPFDPIPSGFDASSVPEIYKFYTNKQIREMIEKASGISK